MAQLSASTPPQVFESWAITREGLWTLAVRLLRILERETDGASSEVWVSVPGIDGVIKSEEDWNDTITPEFWTQKFRGALIWLSANKRPGTAYVDITCGPSGRVSVTVHGGTETQRYGLTSALANEVGLHTRAPVSRKRYRWAIYLIAYLAVALTSIATGIVVSAFREGDQADIVSVGCQLLAIVLLSIPAYRLIGRADQYLRMNLPRVEALLPDGTARYVEVEANYRRYALVGYSLVAIVVAVIGVLLAET